MLLMTLLGAMIGIFSPQAAPYVGSVPAYCLMVSLYISFMPLKPCDLTGTLHHHSGAIVWFIVVRQFLLPSILYVLFRFVAPDYALAALLLGGASTAAMAPFFAHLLGGNVAFTTILTVASSFILPLSLPMLVKLWAGKIIDISIVSMMLTLAQMILLPAFAVVLTRRFLPKLAIKVYNQGYFWGMATIFLSTIAIFSRYSNLFNSAPEIVWEALYTALSVGFLSGVLAWLMAAFLASNVRLTFVVSTVLLNLVLIVVLSSEFFGPREAITAVMYTVPFYALVLPLRWWIQAAEKRNNTPTEKTASL